MIRSEKAVSEVIGMVMVLSIMVIVIGSIMLVGVPLIESSRDRAKMDVAANTFLSLQNDIEEVVRGPIWVRDPTNLSLINGTGPSREMEFDLMGGTLSVFPNKTSIACIPVNCSNVSNPTIIIPSSNIEYTADNENIAYENGAVIRKYESGIPLMISEPIISIYNTADNRTNPLASSITISIHAVSLNRTLSSVGGDGKAYVETRLESYKQIVEPQSPPNPNINLTNITIYSNYPETWRVFFDKKLSEAGLVPSPKGNRTGYNISEPTPEEVEVQIYGNAQNTSQPDIFLSVYESRLNINLR